MTRRIESQNPRQHAPRWWWNIREIILGANDGLVSTLAFVAGASAAVTEPELILLATIIEVVAGSISMGFGAWVASRSRVELENREMEVEDEHLRMRRGEEQAELESYFRRHGLGDADVRHVSGIISCNPDLFLSMMGGLELGVQAVQESPFRAGWSMAAAFVVGSLAPALPFLLLSRPMVALPVAIVASAFFLIGVGIWRSYVGGKGRVRTILEMLLVGTVATAAGYFLGHLAAGILG